jgi:ribosome biogenesis GTPase A
MAKEENIEKVIVQWYPGHMAKAHRMIKGNLKLVDVVVELLDARIPYSSANPMIAEVAQGKKRLIALNKSDLADEKITREWINKFKAEGLAVVTIDALTGKGMKNLTKAIEEQAKEKIARLAAKGLKTQNVRAMILGIPNVGKSSLINRLRGAAIAKTADKPGVTRNKQWIKVSRELDLLDTPGVLWPKFEDERVGLHLAFTGAINDEIYDTEKVMREFLRFMLAEYPDRLKERYKLAAEDVLLGADEVLEKIGAKRGCLRSGGVVDQEAARRIVLNEFRGGKLGKITLDKP